MIAMETLPFLVALLGLTYGSDQFCPLETCTWHNKTYCGAIPCAQPAICKQEIVWPEGICCPYCPDQEDPYSEDITKRILTETDCPNNCTQGGVMYCHPIPCPHPPCDNPVLDEGACCEHCPHKITERLLTETDCPHNCTQGGVVYCHPIPCPYPPCDNPVLDKGACCEHCPDSISKRILTETHCTHNCTQGGVVYCHPIPCPLQPCVDPVFAKGACCNHCPNGRNCRSPDGVPIPYEHWRIIDGKNCTCTVPIQDAVCV